MEAIKQLPHALSWKVCSFLEKSAIKEEGMACPTCSKAIIWGKLWRVVVVVGLEMGRVEREI